MKKKVGFYCADCLSDANIGHYTDKPGLCVVCRNKSGYGNYVSRKDLNDAYPSGEDENGWFWRYCMPGYNVARTDCVCPHCGYSVFDRLNPMHQEGNQPIYKCNCCSHPIHTGGSSSTAHFYSESWAKNSGDIKEWIRFNKILVRPGEVYSMNGKKLHLVTDRKTCFFVDRNHEVVSKMLTINTVKASRVIGVSQRVIDYMFWNDLNSECAWSIR